MYDRIDSIAALLPLRLRKAILEQPKSILSNIREIRLRARRALMLDCLNGNIVTIEECGLISGGDITAVMNSISDYSMNSVRNELKRGYVTLENACRVGIVGEVVIRDGKIEMMKNITGINFRIPRECIGCAVPVFSEIYDGTNINNTLIISPPLMGKTTITRDLARILGDKMNVCIIDERSEIAACSHGAPQMDVGVRTDVIDSCPKTEGIYMALRSMSPSVIITDEIGTVEDGEALYDISRCGVNFIATMHAKNIEDCKKRACTEQLFDEGMIKRVVVLGNSRGVGTVEEVIHI